MRMPLPSEGARKLESDLHFLNQQLRCSFPAVQIIFPDCLTQAARVLTPTGLTAYLGLASALAKMGRGPEAVVAFLQTWPAVAQTAGEATLSDVSALLQAMQKSPNSQAMAPLLHTLPAVARCLQGREEGGKVDDNADGEGEEGLRHYLDTIRAVMLATTVSIHGHHATFASPGLPVLLAQAPRLLRVLTVAGFARWADYGLLHYADHPDRQRDYFSLQLPDSRAVLQRERQGTLFSTVERQLEATLRALWQDTALLHAYATGLDDGPSTSAIAAPWFTAEAICLPDVYSESHGVSGLNRYRLALAHIAAHRRWSTPLVADNLSPLQRLTVECLEDARIDHLLLRRFPGLRLQLLALHPHPDEHACDTATHSSLLHRLVMLSRALLDAQHGYTDAALLACVARFHHLLQEGTSSTEVMRTLALSHAARSRLQSDQLARVYFDNTQVSYRDDNSHLWTFIEQGDEEETFAPTPSPQAVDLYALPPRLYPEWDAPTQSYRPDWVSVRDSLHPSADARHIDTLLAKHATLARQLQRLLDLLQPQDRVRIRYQEEGSELDLDVAVRSLIDWRAGAAPDSRILMSHRSSDRSIAVLVLLDLSESLNDEVPGTGQTRLALSQEAVALLAWAVDQLGDPLAIAGFHSNTRHDLRYQHIMGFGERWGDAPKARLAAVDAKFSTRMGAALRHAAHTLSAQKVDKKLLLVLTDGCPSDVDVSDDQLLIADTHQAVQELAQLGIHSHCISLDPQADVYVHRMFGHHTTVVDRLVQLPERLAQLFVRLTR